MMDDDLDWSGISAYEQERREFVAACYQEKYCCEDCCNPEPEEYTHIKLEIYATRSKNES